MSAPAGDHTETVHQQLGKLEGTVQAIEGRIGGLEEGQREARLQSTREHAEVRRDFQAAIERIEDALAGRLNKHAEEIDDLQESRAKIFAVIAFAVGFASFAGTIAGVLVATGAL